MTDLQQDLSRFFATSCFDMARTREIADVHVSSVQQKNLVARLDRYIGTPSAIHARRLIERIKEL